MRHALNIGGWALVALLVGLAPIAHAQPAGSDVEAGEEEGEQEALDPRSQEARALFVRGRDLAHDRRFSEAADSFRQSLALVDRPSSRFNLAVCYYALERYVEAISQLERYLQTADRAAEGESWDDALRMITHARRSVSELALEVVPAEASVTIDGVPLEGSGHRTTHLNPGPHVVRVEAEGHSPALMTVQTSPGETLVRAVELEGTRRRPRLTVSAGGSGPIRVDGDEVGLTAASLELDPGPHLVQLGDGEHASTREIELDWNEHTRLELGRGGRDGAGVDDALLWASLGGGAAAVVLGVVITSIVASNVLDEETDGIVLTPTATVSLSEP